MQVQNRGVNSGLTFICPVAGKVKLGALKVGSRSSFTRGASWREGCGHEGKWDERPCPSPSWIAMVIGVHLG